MKITPPQFQVDSTTRSFLLLSTTLSYHMFRTGFELGAYGELFYVHKIVAWSLVTGALIALLLLPRQQSGIKTWQLLVLFIPSLWVFLTSYFGFQNQGVIIKPGLFILATLSYLICFPYAIYIVVEIINPDLLAIKGYKYKIGITIILFLFFIFGFLYGENNHLFMLCQDFEIAGNMPPENCLIQQVTKDYD
ncbi:MAG: hypothetical protein GY694_10600 [Gammaproteobacteria bacterium]|nr:hypothetical protein [Gammaproteobacteria bacterium]